MFRRAKKKHTLRNEVQTHKPMSLEKTQSPIKTMNTPVKPKSKAETKSYPPPESQMQHTDPQGPPNKKGKQKEKLQKVRSKGSPKKRRRNRYSPPPAHLNVPKKAGQ